MGQLRAVALAAVLAIAVSALLPIAHGAMAHSGDCGVCSAIYHGGARSADTVSAPEPSAARACVRVEEGAPVPLETRRHVDPYSARAPPASSVLA